MSEVRRIHRRKIRRRVRDLQNQQQGRAVAAFCLAKSVAPQTFKMPLDLSRVQIPAGYED